MKILVERVRALPKKPLGLFVVFALFLIGVWLFIASRQRSTTEQNLHTKPTSLVVSEGQINAKCFVDFNRIDYGYIDLGGGLVLRAWTKCHFADGGLEFITIPLFVHDHQMVHLSIANRPENPPRGVPEFSEAGVRSLVTKIVQSNRWPQKTHVRVLAGLDSGSMIQYDDPYPTIYRKLNLTNKFSAGDPNDLPLINQAAVSNFLLTYRVTALK